MFKVKDLVVYGNSGVCRITDITTPDMSGIPKEQLYYVLKPIYQDKTVFYAPVDNPKVFMRPVISQRQANALIDEIPSIDAEAFCCRSTQELATHYEEQMQKHNCADLLALTMSLYSKKKSAESQKRKFGQVDDRFMKRAEELIFDEFSVALGIPKDEVSAYIDARVEAAKKKNAPSAKQ